MNKKMFTLMLFKPLNDGVSFVEHTNVAVGNNTFLQYYFF